MKSFTVLNALAVPLDRANVDTDAIIPKQFLKSIKRSGFGVNLFDSWRYTDPGYPGKPQQERQVNPDFVLNHPRYADAEILIARENFGCGSSREHAVWALDDYGIRAVIAPSFADIFHNNSFKSGLLPVRLEAETVARLIGECEDQEGFKLTIDLPEQVVVTPSGDRLSFEVDSFRKSCLLNGLDDIGLTLENAERIREFEARKHNSRPWLVGG